MSSGGKNDLHQALRNELKGNIASPSFDGDQPLHGGNTKAVPDDETAFVHLHVHSAFSLLEGALPIASLIELALADYQPALAITDRNNLFGALEFSQKAAAKGLQPIMASKIAIDFEDGFDAVPRNGSPDYPWLVLIAMDAKGFGNLKKLVSKAHLESPNNLDPHVTFAQLSSLSEGLICLTGGKKDGPIDRLLAQGQDSEAATRLDGLKRHFGDRLYVEIQRHGEDDPSAESAILALAYDCELPIVATNQPLFPKPEDFPAHDALICIADGTRVGMEERRRFTGQHYFKSAKEMQTLFADLPEALENTIEIARRCTFHDRTCDPILPRFSEDAANADGDEAIGAEARELRAQAIAGLEQRLKQHPLAEGFSRDDYDSRLAFELDIIEQMQYPGYFLIVADFIKWAKEQGIAVGPGRGSGAGSLVAWALTITDIDPMRFSLLFERFLNPERVSMPDFDIDFCQERREEVIRYVQKRYGADQVAQIITFGTLQARAVLRDVGRVLQMPYGQVDRLCKLVPNNPANPVTLTQAIDGEPRLQEAAQEEEIVERLFDISKRLEGLYRHASTHAAGIVIGDRKLDELVPLYRDPRSDMPVTQYNMKWVEQAGLVKFDFLGLKTLTVIEKAVEFIRASGKQIDIAEIPLDDADTYKMLTKGETVGVFQLESAGMRKALIGMRPDRFEDIIALVALYRPGPMDNIPTYNRRKHGEEVPDYYHEKIEAILKETYGVIIYQEQVMQIAQVLSGYSLGEADLLRRAMGKKIKSEMDAQRERFVTGCVERDLSKPQAEMIFDLLAKFANYGFNKSHAAAYALVSYQTAWLRSNHPVEFLAASMQMDMGLTDKLAVFYQDAKTHNIEVVPPSVQTSHAGFTVSDGKIVYALAAVKGVGEGAVRDIIAERERNGEFASLEDFFTRIDPRQVNKRMLENLICAGAFDCFGRTREQLIAGLDRLLAHSSRVTSDRESGQNDMFGGDTAENKMIDLPGVETPWDTGARLTNELSSIGFYLSAHPLDEHADILERMFVKSYRDFEQSIKTGSSAGRIAGTIISKQERKTRTGKPLGILTLSDPSGPYEAVLFDDVLHRYRDMLEPGKSVIIQGSGDDRPEGVSIRIQSVELLETAANREQRDMRIFLRDASPVPGLKTLLKRNGKGTVFLVVLRDVPGGEVEVELPDRYEIDTKIQSAMRSVPGVVEVSLQ